jgi:predicted Zn-dependent protease
VNTDAHGTVDLALERARALLASEPALAELQANEILQVLPDHPVAQLLRATARIALARHAEAIADLESLERLQPQAPAVPFELSRAYAGAGRCGEALLAVQRALKLKPDFADAWRVLGDHALALGDSRTADDAYARHLHFSAREPGLQLKNYCANICGAGRKTLALYACSQSWPRDWDATATHRTC